MMDVRIKSRNRYLNTVIVLIIFLLFIGYFMNFQNLWEYWPSSNKVGDAGIELIMSVVGVFVPPLGVLTGWIW